MTQDHMTRYTRRMNWQTYYIDAAGDWCESVLLKDMTEAEAEAWILECDEVYDLGYKIEAAR